MHYPSYQLSFLGVLVGFVETKRDVEESSDAIVVCVEVCDGVLKRDVEINVEAQSYTAIG